MAGKRLSTTFYRKISLIYDALDRMYFTSGGRNPREIVGEMIRKDKAKVLDLCCGTFANGLVVACKRPDATVIGLDRSKQMLRRARLKVNDKRLKNVKLLCRDATDTGIKGGTFDYIIIGLVLHECDPGLWKAILSEAGRLLTDDGRLIILDWDTQESIKGKLKFSPLYLCESIATPKYFREYYYSDKRLFFEEYGFEMERMERCDVTFVASFRKKEMADRDDQYLKETRMLNYRADHIGKLVKARRWEALGEYEKIGAVYDFVRNEIRFGYNRSDLLTAEEVLKDGYGQCNTKGTLLMALLRAVGVPCRLHGSEVSKDFQRGATSGIVSKLAPERIVHTWVEVFHEGKWTSLEGVITDEAYVRGVRKHCPGKRGAFKEYAISVQDIHALDLNWKGDDLFVQNTSVVEDYGVFESPDAFFKEHRQTLNRVKAFAYVHYGRKVMNRNVSRIRQSGM